VAGGQDEVVATLGEAVGIDGADTRGGPGDEGGALRVGIAHVFLLRGDDVLSRRAFDGPRRLTQGVAKARGAGRCVALGAHTCRYNKRGGVLKERKKGGKKLAPWLVAFWDRRGTSSDARRASSAPATLALRPPASGAILGGMSTKPTPKLTPPLKVH